MYEDEKCLRLNFPIFFGCQNRFLWYKDEEELTWHLIPRRQKKCHFSWINQSLQSKQAWKLFATSFLTEQRWNEYLQLIINFFHYWNASHSVSRFEARFCLSNSQPGILMLFDYVTSLQKLNSIFHLQKTERNLVLVKCLGKMQVDRFV